MDVRGKTVVIMSLVLPTYIRSRHTYSTAPFSSVEAFFVGTSILCRHLIPNMRHFFSILINVKMSDMPRHFFRRLQLSAIHPVGQKIIEPGIQSRIKFQEKCTFSFFIF